LEKVFICRENLAIYNAAAGVVVVRLRFPPMSACDKQISKDEAVRRHASRFNASWIFWCASYCM